MCLFVNVSAVRVPAVAQSAQAQGAGSDSLLAGAGRLLRQPEKKPEYDGKFPSTDAKFSLARHHRRWFYSWQVSVEEGTYGWKDLLHPSLSQDTGVMV